MLFDKEENITWDLDKYRDLLKSKKNPEVIMTELDNNTLLNDVNKVF